MKNRILSNALIIVLFFVAECNVAIAQGSLSLSKMVADLSRESVLKHASLSVCVYDLDKKTEVYAFNSQRAMAPASVAKLITTAVGFEKLGGKFRFRTTVAYSGDIDKNGTLHGDIYIIGGGDPLLGSYRYKQTVPDSLFAAWHQAVAAAGVKAVDGRVRYDASIFDNHPIPDSWQWGDIGNYYGSGATGLNFHENMFFIYFNPGARIGYPATVERMSPNGLNLHLVNEVMTGHAKSGDQVVVYGEPNSTIRICAGTVPVDSKNFSVRASLPKPAQTCADLFTVYLRSHKIAVSGAASEMVRKPQKMVNLLDYTSPVYSLIAQYTNVTSNNTYAEAIHKYLGFKAYGMGSHANGTKVVMDYIQKHGLEASGVKLEDGSGLSPMDRVTTDFICRFLVDASKCSFFSEYLKSIALVGENGNVKNMLSGLPQGTSVRIKTGTMTGVRGYAGYVTTAKGNRYSFAVICNDFDCTSAQIRPKLENIVKKIATLE